MHQCRVHRIIAAMRLDEKWRQRLKEIADGYPGKQKGLSLAAGLSSTAVRDIVERGATPKLDTILAICAAAHVDLFALLYGDEVPRVRVPVVGIASAGEGWVVEGHAIAELEFSLQRDDLIAIEVRGDSMAPVYRNGDHLICQRHQRGFDNLIGLDCVVLTVDGKGYLKILRRGSRPNRFSLKSYNVVTEDVENVQLAWAAPVVWIKRRSV